MAQELKALGALNDATEWMHCPAGLVDISIGTGLTGTVVLEQRFNEGAALPVHDETGAPMEWTTPADVTLEVAGTDKREYRLRCSAYTSGSAQVLMGY